MGDRALRRRQGEVRELEERDEGLMTLLIVEAFAHVGEGRERCSGCNRLSHDYPVTGSTSVPASTPSILELDPDTLDVGRLESAPVGEVDILHRELVRVVAKCGGNFGCYDEAARAGVHERSNGNGPLRENIRECQICVGDAHLHGLNIASKPLS